MKVLFSTVAVVAIFGASALAGIGIMRVANSDPKSAGKPTQGSVERAMEQARRLMAELQASGWNGHQVDPGLLRLPDQDIAETELKRAPGRPSFFVYSQSHPIYGDDVAFSASTYVRENITADLQAPEGQRGNPSGFFIVGYRNGAVTQVPIGQVRVLWTDLAGRRVGYNVFPGMNEYSETLPLLVR